GGKALRVEEEGPDGFGRGVYLEVLLEVRHGPSPSLSPRLVARSERLSSKGGPLPQWGRGLEGGTALQGGEDPLGSEGELGHGSARGAGDGVHDSGGGRCHGWLANTLGAEGPEALARFQEHGDHGRRVERGGDLVIEEMRILRHALLEDHFLQ